VSSKKLEGRPLSQQEVSKTRKEENRDWAVSPLESGKRSTSLLGTEKKRGESTCAFLDFRLVRLSSLLVKTNIRARKTP